MSNKAFLIIPPERAVLQLKPTCQAMPADYQNYTPGFKQRARLLIIERGNVCQHCGVANWAVGHWYTVEQEKRLQWRPFEEADNAVQAKSYSEARRYARSYYDGLRVVKLQVAHVDQDTLNDDPANLLVLCQACHLALDRAHNRDKRRYGWSGRHLGQFRLFADCPYAPDPDNAQLPPTPRQKRIYVRKSKTERGAEDFAKKQGVKLT